MKKVLIGLGVMLLVLVAVILIAPAMIDWNQYKGRITEQAEAATGRKLVIGGDLSVSILPRPALSAADVRLSNAPGGTAEHMLAIDSLSVDVAFLPLLSGEIKVAAVTLISPRVAIETLPDGTTNLDMGPTTGERVSGAVPPANGAPDDATPDDATPDDATPVDTTPVDTGPSDGPPAISIDRLVIEDGLVVYRDLGAGSEERAADLNAEISLDSLSGPATARGSVTLRDIPLTFDIGIGQLGGDRATPIDVRLGLSRSDAHVAVAGLVSEQSAGPTVRGTLEAKGGDLADAIARAAPGTELPPALEKAFGLSGQLTASAAAVKLEDAVLTLGAARGTGSLAVALGAVPDATVALTFSRIDLDDWLPAPQAKRAAPSVLAALAQEPRAPAAPAVPAGGFSLPDTVRAQLDLGVEALSWRDGVVNQLRVNAALAGGEVTINQMGALLPGGSEASAFGFVTAKDGRPLLDLTLEAESDNLRGLLGWVGVDVSTVPNDRLRQFRASATVGGGPAEVTVRDLTGQIDTTSFTGAATLRPADRPSMGVSLALDRIDIDAYVPAQAGPETRGDASPASNGTPGAAVAQETDAEPDGARAPSASAAPLAALQALNTFDANLNLSVGQAMYGGQTARDLTLKASLLRGSLTLDPFRVASFADSAVVLRGTIGGFGAAPTFDGLAWTVESQRPDRLAKAFGLDPLPLPVAALTPLALRGSMTGTLSKLEVTARSGLGGLAVTTQGTATDLLSAPRLDLSIGAAHGSLAGLLRSFDYIPAGGNGLGPFELSGRLAGDLDGISLSDLDLVAGPTKATGKATLALSGARPKLTATLAAGGVPLDLLLPAERTATLDRRYWDLPETLGARPAAMRLSRPDTRSMIRPAAAPWSREPLDLAALRAFDAAITLTADSLSQGAWEVTGLAADMALTNGKAAMTALTGKLNGGSLTAEAAFDAARPVPTGALTAKVSGADLGQRVQAGGLRMVGGTLGLDIDLATEGASSEALARALAGRVNGTVIDGALGGFNLNDLGGLADRVKSDPLSAMQLFQGRAQGGGTRFRELVADFEVKGGIARSTVLRLVTGEGQASGTAVVDLPGWQIDARMAFNPKDLENAPPIPFGYSGPLDQPRSFVDMQPLIGWAAKRFGGELGGGALGGVLENLLGGQRSRPQAQPQAQPEAQPQQDPATGQSGQQEQPQQQPRPERLLENLLKEFGR